MNWTPIIIAGVSPFAVLMWFVKGKHNYVVSEKLDATSLHEAPVVENRHVVDKEREYGWKSKA